MIKTNSIIQYIETTFNKSIEKITKEEFESISTIPLSFNMFDVEDDFRIDDLKEFPNLKNVVISNYMLQKSDLEVLKNLNLYELSLKKCSFSKDCEMSDLNEIKSLELLKCNVEDYSFIENMNNLENIVIFKPEVNKNINFRTISQALKILTLSNCDVNELEFLRRKPIEMLNLLGSKLPENYLEIINSMDLLSKLYISKEYDNEVLHDKMEVYNDLTNLLYEKEVKKI